MRRVTTPPKLRSVLMIVVIAAVVTFGSVVNLYVRAASITGDLNNDGTVNVFDLSLLLNDWNKISVPGDINGDGSINIFDLSILLAHWGETAPTPSPTVSVSPSPVVTPSPTPVASACDQAAISAMVNNVSETNIRAYEQELVQDDTKPKPNELISRWIGNPGNQIKTDYMRDTWASLGLQAAEQSFTADGYAQNNVTAILAGKDTNTFYGVSSHHDADSEVHDTWAQAANDDASGSAVTLEVARVLKPFQSCLKSSIYFAGFNDEEFSMEGSIKFVNELGTKVIKGWYDLDEIGYGTGLPDCIRHRSYATATAGAAIAAKAQDVNTKYGIGQGMQVGTTNDDGTDAYDFTTKGLPGIMVDQCGNFDNIRESTQDNLAKINYSQMTKEAKIMVAALAELATQ